MAENKDTHLAELQHKPYYKIPKDQPDVTGWYIVDEAAKKVGTVLDLLIDPEAEKVRYVITNLKDGMMEEDRTILIPIGKCRLNREDERLVIPPLSRGQLTGLPHYTGPEKLSPEEEQVIRDTFSEAEGRKGKTVAYDRKTFYEDEMFDEDRFYTRDRNA